MSPVVPIPKKVVVRPSLLTTSCRVEISVVFDQGTISVGIVREFLVASLGVGAGPARISVGRASVEEIVEAPGDLGGIVLWTAVIVAERLQP